MFRNIIFSLVLLTVVNNPALGQSSKQGKAATVADARAVLDLSVEPIADPVDDPGLGVASQSFTAAGNAADVGRAINQRLEGSGLKAMDGSTFTNDYASATYKKFGFNFSLMVMPSGEPGKVRVALMNHGNVDVAMLPKPDGTRDLYVQPASGIFVCELSVDDAKRICREQLQRDGWEWFGDTAVSFFMRQNAVRLQVMCSDSPANPGKATLQFSTEQMSSALPTIADLVRIAYSDTTMTLDGDSKLPAGEFVTTYRKKLESEGWKATTENPIKIDFREHLIFRNVDNELAELIYQSVDSITRFELKFQTAAQVDRESKRAQRAVALAQEKRAAEQARMADPPKIEIDMPETAKLTSQTKQVLEFRVKSGTARSVFEKWMAGMKSKGWRMEATIDSPQVGDFKLTHDDQTIGLTYIDPGFVPGEISITTSPEFQLKMSDSRSR